MYLVIPSLPPLFVYFLYCHPYFNHQFYSIVFMLVISYIVLHGHCIQYGNYSITEKDYDVYYCCCSFIFKEIVKYANWAQIDITRVMECNGEVPFLVKEWVVHSNFHSDVIITSCMMLYCAIYILLVIQHELLYSIYKVVICKQSVRDCKFNNCSWIYIVLDATHCQVLFLVS